MEQPFNARETVSGNVPGNVTLILWLISGVMCPKQKGIIKMLLVFQLKQKQKVISGLCYEHLPTLKTWFSTLETGYLLWGVVAHWVELEVLPGSLFYYRKF